jgi:uncharacterized protein YifN (PemK superfamily)
MPIPFSIRLAAGQIVMVDFGPDPREIAPPGIMKGPLGVLPEIYKERHAIVISTTNGLTTVVPFSTSAPKTPQNFHYKINAGSYPGMSTTEDCWVKSDLITTVSNARIDRPLSAGRRTTVILNASDLKAVRKTVLHALRMGTLTSHL